LFHPGNQDPKKKIATIMRTIAKMIHPKTCQVLAEE